MKAKEFDKKFDKGESVMRNLDLASARRPDEEQHRVNVDFPNQRKMLRKKLQEESKAVRGISLQVLKEFEKNKNQ